MTSVREPAVAGIFYPSDPRELERMVSSQLAAAASEPQPAWPKAVIAPHAGYVYSGPVAASVYALLRPSRGHVRRVVLMGPSHRVPFRGFAVTGAEYYRTPLGMIPIDREAVAALASVVGIGVLEPAHADEHSLEVHLPFLQKVLGDFTLVPIVAGRATPAETAAVLKALWGGPETLIVISTDLSHYLDYDAARRTDAVTVAAIERLDPQSIGGEQACGHVPVGGLLVEARRRRLRIDTIDVRNSGDTAGPRDRVVGYGAWALYEEHSGASQEESEDYAAQLKELGDRLLTLARSSIRHGLERGGPLPVVVDDFPEVLRRPAAVFVTLKRNADLRGCIGSVVARRPLVEDIAANAYASAFKDPRFPPLTGAELEGLEISLSILSLPAPMRFSSQEDLLAQLRPRRDGLIIEDRGRRGLFLPAVWDSLPEPRNFLANLKIKAGLAPAHWSETVTVERFEAIEIGK